MEEENRVFGSDAENIKDFDSVEKINIYHKDKEDIEKNIRASAKDLEDFFDSVIKDVPAPTEEEVNEGIRKILERAYPEKKTKKSRKTAIKVLFAAAILSAFTFSCLFVIGNSHNVKIENGFVTFAKDTMKVVFYGEEKEEYIDVKTLLEDLSLHKFEDILIPQELYKCKSTLPIYSKGVENVGNNDKVTFNLYDDGIICSFKIDRFDDEISDGNFIDIDNAETIIVDDIYIHIFEYENGLSCIRFQNGGYMYLIQSETSLSEMKNIAQTLIKTEE